MTNIEITQLQSDNQIENLEELSESELMAVVGGAGLNPQTEIGKTLLHGLEALVKKAEQKLEEQL